MTPADYQSKILARVDEEIEILALNWRSMGGEERELEKALVPHRALRVAVERCSVNGYTTWDKSMVPMVEGKYDSIEAEKWEKAHGHDIRLKCYPEFGCQLLIDPEDLLLAIGKEMWIDE